MRKTISFICLIIGLSIQSQVLVYDINQEIDFDIINYGSGQIYYDTIQINFEETVLDFVFRFRDYGIGPEGFPEIFSENLTTRLENTSQIEVSSSVVVPGGFTNSLGIDCDVNACNFNYAGYYPSYWITGASWGKNLNDSIGPNTFSSSAHALLHEYLIGYLFDPVSWNICGQCNQSREFLAIRVLKNNLWHYGWMKLAAESNGQVYIEKIGINQSHEEGIIAGQADAFYAPLGLNQNYSQSPLGVHLIWEAFPNAEGCQVRGGLLGGSDPHTFIVTTSPYNQLFINGSSLTIGQEYQWKVRCATGINPYSGISEWSDYDYFIYDP
ncbi:MAG: hypothetical protein AAF487_11470 [Bacteroidota bacterium]